MSTHNTERNEQVNESQTQWHQGWFARFPQQLYGPSVTVDENDKATKWLEKVSAEWVMKVEVRYLAEKSRPLADCVQLGSTHKADIKLKKGNLFLVNRELTKLEMMKNECFFNSTVWLVDYSRLNCSLEEHLEEYSSMREYISKNHSKGEYLSNCNNEIEKLSENLEVLSKKKYSDRVEYDITSTHKRMESIRRHIQEMEAGSTALDEYFLENEWEKCTTFPWFDDYVKRFHYSASPLFLDTGEFLLLRKYKLYSSLNVVPYLKKVSYDDFMRWAL